MSEQISFYNGSPISDVEFAAVASIDRMESPEEPSGTALLMTLSVVDGWSEPIKIDERRISDVGRMLHNGHAADVVALSEDGVLFSFKNATPISKIGNLGGSSARALARSNLQDYILGNFGYYFSRSSETDMSLITSEFIVPSPDWDADDDIWDAHFKSQTHIMNAEASPDGRVAMTEISKLMFLETDLTLTEVIHPRIFVGVTYDPESRQFWFCGHSPLPIVGRESSKGIVETVFVGDTKGHTFTDLAVYDNDVYLADTNLSAGGFHVLSLEDSSSEYELSPVELPDGFGNLPVWKVDTFGKALWVLRTKDLLRFDGDEWNRFPIPQVSIRDKE